MTTHSTAFPETSVPPARKLPTDGFSATEAIESAGSELKTKARHMYESGRTRVTEWRGGFQEGIREKPIQSVLIAVAVGAVIGALVGRRSS